MKLNRVGSRSHRLQVEETFRLYSDFRLLTSDLRLQTFMQTTSHILMIRPVNFGYNAETAVNNAFQVKGEEDDVQNKALKEFDVFVNVLQQNGVDVTVVEDTPEPHTPDSIFPNNWVSFHMMALYCYTPCMQ